MKGVSSGHIQIVKEIFLDCEGNSLLFKVEQKVGACHNGYFSRYYISLIIFLAIWIGASILFRKYKPLRKPTFGNVILPIIISNLVVLGSITLLMYFFRTTFYSRTIVFGTTLFASFFEFIFSSLYFFLKIAIEYQNPPDNEYIALRAQQLNGNNHRKYGIGERVH